MAVTSPPARASAASAPPRSSAISALARKPRSRNSGQKRGCSSRGRLGGCARGAFMREQPALALDATTIAGQGAAGADDAVAGHDDADGLGALGPAHRPPPLCPPHAPPD